ncbi:right-handed parallel beta-helix repeat-containing protein [Arthrobacter sp. 2YAF22_2]
MTIEGSGPGTVIVQSVASQPTFMALGSSTYLGALTSDLVKGATEIKISNNYRLATGDIILVTDEYSYTETDKTYKSGEQFRVASSTGTSIILDSPVRGSFSNSAGSYSVANGAKLTKLNTVRNVTLRNMAFEGHPSGTSQMIMFQNVDGLFLEGVSTISGQAGFCLIDKCRNVEVVKFGLHGLIDNWAGGYPGYGFIVRHACNNVRIHDGINLMSRHGVTTLGGPFGVPRNLVFANIISTASSTAAGIDTHCAGEGIVISDCIVENAHSGINARARNITIRNNDVRNTNKNGILVSDSARNVVVEGNRLTGCSTYGIRIGASGSRHSNVSVISNELTDISGDAISAGEGQTDLRIVSNLCTRMSGKGIEVHAGSSGVYIARNDVADAALVQTAAGINVTGQQVAGTFDIIGNIVRQNESRMSRAIFTTRTQGRMIGNYACGTYLSSGSEFSAGIGFTRAENSVFV